jgi:hypothetical protein
MLFSIIYTVDIPRDDSIVRFKPPFIHKWDMTEGDEQYEYDYLGGVWEKGKHRKWCALLTKAEFVVFIDECQLLSEDCETMGSIGAPGFGVGWSPAIQFNIEDSYSNVIGSAYVTPIPEIKNKEGGVFDDRDWERVRRCVIDMFKYGVESDMYRKYVTPFHAKRNKK